MRNSWIFWKQYTKYNNLTFWTISNFFTTKQFGSVNKNLSTNHDTQNVTHYIIICLMII